MALLRETLQAPRPELVQAYAEFFSRAAAFRCKPRYARGLPRALTAR